MEKYASSYKSKAKLIRTYSDSTNSMKLLVRYAKSRLKQCGGGRIKVTSQVSARKKNHQIVRRKKFQHQLQVQSQKNKALDRI